MPPLYIEKYFHLFWSIETNILKVSLIFCSLFAAVTALYGQFERGPGHLFTSFPTVCSYFHIVLFILGLLLKSPPLFRFMFVIF